MRNIVTDIAFDKQLTNRSGCLSGRKFPLKTLALREPNLEWESCGASEFLLCLLHA